MKCKEVQILLTDYPQSKVEWTDDFLHHLNNCHHCLAYRDTILPAIDEIHRRKTDISANPYLSARVLAAIGSGESKRWSLSLSYSLQSLVLSFLLIFAVLTGFYIGQSGLNSDAAAYLYEGDDYVSSLQMMSFEEKYIRILDDEN